jgi:hypothetical protein
MASDNDKLPAEVIDIAGAKRKRDKEEELRLEQQVIERWTGNSEKEQPNGD